MSWFKRCKHWLFRVGSGRSSVFHPAVEAPATRAEWATTRGFEYLARYGDVGHFVLDEIDKALSLDRRSASAYFIRSTIHRKKGRLRQALKDLDRALRLDPADPSILTERGIVHCMMGNPRRAIRELDRALGLDSTNVVARTERGLAYRNLAEYEMALADLEAAISEDPSDQIAFQNLGALHADNGDAKRALPFFERASRLDPAPEHLFNLGSVLMQLGEDGPASAAFSRVLREQEVGRIRDEAAKLLDQIRARSPVVSEPSWSLEREMWTEFLVLSPEATVWTLLAQWRKQRPYFVVLSHGGRYAVRSIYGADGMRAVLSEQADLIGPAILDIQLGSIKGLWKSCRPVGRQEGAVSVNQAKETSGGATVVVEGGEVLGVLGEVGTGAQPPGLATVLFGRTLRFGRNGSPGGPLRRCARCDAVFAYYQLSLSQATEDRRDEGHYLCPQCGAGARGQWLEERLRPGAWSESGFLDQDESLAELIASDQAHLEQLGIGVGSIADRLESLIEQSSAAYEVAVTAHLEAGLNQLETMDPEPSRDSPRVPWCEDLDDLRRRAGGHGWMHCHWWGARVGAKELPPEDVGVRLGRHQVFLHIYAGYQYCPWTEPIRRCNFPVPEPYARANELEQGTVVRVIPGQAFSCDEKKLYRHADRDFLIVNRSTGERIRGSGLLAHLIREHRFFGGRTRAYRLDPGRAARVLGLL